MGSTTWEVVSSSTPLEIWWSATGRTPWWRGQGLWCIFGSPSRPRESALQALRAVCRNSARPQMPARRPSRASGRSSRCCSSRNAGSCTPGRKASGRRTSPRIDTRTSFPVRLGLGSHGDQVLAHQVQGLSGRGVLGVEAGVIPHHWCDALSCPFVLCLCSPQVSGDPSSLET